MLAYTRPNTLSYQRRHRKPPPTRVHGYGVYRTRQGWPAVVTFAGPWLATPPEKRPHLIARFDTLASASDYARELGTLVKPEAKAWRERGSK